MKLLLDENLPKKLKLDLATHETYTVRDMGWNGKKNGELLQLMLSNEFDAFLTFDQNLQHQQNFSKYSIAVFVLVAPDNTYITLSPLMPIVLKHLDTQLQVGVVIIEG